MPPHEWSAVYLPHQQLRLQWRREHGRAYEPEWQPPHWGPTQSKLVEVVWKGTSETRGTAIEGYRCAYVDSGVCYLPTPRRTALPGRERRWEITSYEHLLFRLLNQLSGPSGSGETFEAHLRETAIDVRD